MANFEISCASDCVNVPYKVVVPKVCYAGFCKLFCIKLWILSEAGNIKRAVIESTSFYKRIVEYYCLYYVVVSPEKSRSKFRPTYTDIVNYRVPILFYVQGVDQKWVPVR